MNKNGSDLFSKKPDQETTQTYTWILSHLEVDPNVSLPKQEVYDEYRHFCQINRFEPLCVADFGKAMKHAFPCIKPRRLGQRGNSRYCYSGLRKRYKIQPPNLPDMIEPTFCIDNDCSQTYNQIIERCQENPDEFPITNFQPNCDLTSIVNYDGVMNLKKEINNSNGTSQQQHNYNGHSVGQGSSSVAHTKTSVASTSNSSDQQGFMASSNSQRYGYSTFIQQPGSPDDDDYRHTNYQDFGPLPTISDQQHQQHQQTQHHYNLMINTSHQFQPSTSSSSVSGASNFSSIYNHHSPVIKSNTNLDASMSVVAPQASSVATVSTPNNAYLTNEFILNNHQLAYMSNSHHFDACASPFQSPASTPYPSTAPLNIQQDHQYYPSNSNNSNNMNGNNNFIPRYSTNG